jgi:hypothetical protein
MDKRHVAVSGFRILLPNRTATDKHNDVKNKHGE